MAVTKPRWYHKGKHLSWEIYRRSWFITIDFGRVEIQINRWDYR